LSEHSLKKRQGIDNFFRNENSCVGYIDEYNPWIHLWTHTVGGQVLKEKLISFFGHARNLTCGIFRHLKSKYEIRFGQEKGLSSGV